jgi:hypothetical protein
MKELSMNETVDGKTRKTLAGQLDRLDSILDGLSEGLNGAVADAVREATGAAVEQAVHKALLEVLTNPDVLALLAGAAPPRQPASPAADKAERSGLCEGLAGAKAWAAGRARAARDVCHRTLGRLKAGLLGLWRLRRQLLTAVCIGAAVGLAAYPTGPWLSAVAGGLVGGMLSRLGRARDWLQRVFRSGGHADATS